MISDGITVVNPAYLGPYFLWRLLVDQRYQAKATAARRSVWWSSTCARGPAREC